jgi:hypothetical protein
MWSDVQRELAEILSSRLFPTLASDPGYRVLLRNAGLHSIPNTSDGKVNSAFAQAQANWGHSIPLKSALKLHCSTEVLTPADRSRLETAAQICAQLLVKDLIAFDALREQRAKAVVLERPTVIYRVWDAKSDNRTRHWWFSEHLLNLARTQSSLCRQTARDWLRDHLAISLDFGACDHLSKIELTGNAAFPAIEAMGLPKPQRSRVIRNARGETLGSADKDYWERFGAMFQGQKTQYFLPFVPPDRIRDAPWP